MRSVPLNRPAEYGRRESLNEEEYLARARQDEGSRDASESANSFLQHEFGIRTFGYTSMVIDPPDGRVPSMTETGEVMAETARGGGTFSGGPFDSVDDFTLYDRCITRGVIGSILPVIYGNGLRIVQGPDRVAISYEMIHDTRIIWLDGREQLDGDIRQYMGSARGRWEGDTLVVETTNFTDKTSIGGNGNGIPNSEQFRLTERFTRVDPEMIEYHATIEDPVTLTQPFTIRLMITTQPDYVIYEYNCHEGNEAIFNTLSGERMYERQVAEAIAQGLPIPRKATEHTEIRNSVPETFFDINEGE